MTDLDNSENSGRQRRIEELRSAQFRHLREARGYIDTELLELGPEDGDVLEEARELSSQINALAEKMRDRLDDAKSD